MPEALFTAPIRIKIVSERIPDEDGDVPRLDRQKLKKDDGSGSDPAPTHGLPHFALLTRDGRTVANVETEKWPEGFTEHDGAEVTDLGNGETLYKIDYDNACHLRYRATQRSSVAKEVVTEKFVLGMRILLLGYEHALRSLREKSDDPAGLDEFADDFRQMAARGAASTVSALAENLPRIVDSSSLAAEDSD